MAFEMFGAPDDPLRPMKQTERGDLLGIRLFSVSAVGDPEQAPRQRPAVAQTQDEFGQLRHQLLWRDSMRREEIRDPRRLIIGRRKDARAHCPVFSFTDEQAGDEERKGFKDLDPHQRAKVFKQLDNC
ncbi:MAG TPA: hypothetical protein VFD58_27560 [Blastocatellia bacterium]|nr:hypothetical protein [Blastocatellia bacterium]